MKKLYVIRTEDVFLAQTHGLLPEGCISRAGSIWCDVIFTLVEFAAYQKKYPISPA